MLEKVLDKLYAAWQTYKGYGDDADTAFCVAYHAAIEEIEKGGSSVILINGRHIILG